MGWQRALAVRGALSRDECEVLAAHAESFNHPVRALEVGHYFGLSTAVLLESLPVGSVLTTIDHHDGDSLCWPVPIEDFERNIAPHRGRVELLTLYESFQRASVEGPFDLCFYDADHSSAAVAVFWTKYRARMAESSVLLFDDADWPEQATLRELAEADGFKSIRARPFGRGASDKATPTTYTIEVMTR